MPKQKSIVDRLRDAIRQAEGRGVTRYQIHKLTGIPQPVIARIADGKTKNPTLQSAERILHAIGKKFSVE